MEGGGKKEYDVVPSLIVQHGIMYTLTFAS